MKRHHLLALLLAVGGAHAAPPTLPPTPTPAIAVDGVAYSGMTDAMWAEVNAQRALFGDANDCKARVDAIPKSGGVTIGPDASIAEALDANSVVFLKPGTYRLPKRLVIPIGKKLIGQGAVTLDARDADIGVVLQDNSVLSNVMVRDAGDIGINLYTSKGDHGSFGTLLHRVSVARSGTMPTSDGGIGIVVTQKASGNCVVSVETFDNWNPIGSDGLTTSITAHGGNADGIQLSFGAHHNTLIDVASYRNGDDGIDAWQGGQLYVYFSRAFDNGKTTGKTLVGDGNGIKLGSGAVAHKFYKTTATSNLACGYDRNGNTQDAILVKSKASGNPAGDYCYFLVAP